MNSLLRSTKGLLVALALNTDVIPAQVTITGQAELPRGQWKPERLLSLWLHHAHVAQVEGYHQLQQISFQQNGVGLTEAVLCLTANFVRLPGKLF